MANKSPSAHWRKFLFRRLDNLRGFATGWGRTYGDLCNRSRQIFDKMTTNAATFPAPTVPLATLQTQIDNMIYADSWKGNAGGSARTLARHAASEDLINTLASLGSYVASIARASGGSVKQQYTVLSQSGFPLVKVGRVNLASPWVSQQIPGIPKNVRQQAGKIAGAYSVRWQKVPKAKYYVIYDADQNLVIKTLTKTLWRIDDSPTQGSQFNMYVVAVGPGGTSGHSQTIKVVAY